MDEQLKSALESISVADLTRADWIAVGMALKESGEPCSVWDAWSRNDPRYHKGECARLWNGFRGTDKPVKAGTIIQMAKDRGWMPFEGSAALGWEDEISYDGTGFDPSGHVTTGGQFSRSASKTVPVPDEDWNPVSDLTAYLELLFEPEERVSYVTNDVHLTEDGKWVPGKGTYNRTVADLLKSLRKHPDDIGATIGDWKEEAGAWIRFNPVDGGGVKNSNVTRFKYALIESDTLPVPEQDAMYRKFELPIAALVHSGGKSLHAIVRIDAPDIDEYYKRVNFLYDFLEKNGLSVDKQNRNPSRLSRMPGVTRNGKRQYLAGTNLGRKSWADWMDFAEGESDELPEIETLADFIANPPELPPALIEGILRRGHKMLLAGPSKAGKSFLLMELCIAIAEGRKWLDFPVKKGRVLYINLEIDKASTVNRFRQIYDALGIKPKFAKDIEVWNLRGYAIPLNQLVPKLIRRIRDQHFDAIVLDPIYKVITGDENNASEMGAFCNQFDRICTATGCSMIYCHHHSKGAQGAKKAMDRASGSGVFSRDPDAQIDIVGLELTDEIANTVRDGDATAWRLETSLREFPNIRPLNLWFEHPIHRIDTSDALQEAVVQGSAKANLRKSGKYSTPKSRAASVSAAYYALNTDPSTPVTVQDMASYMDVTERTARARIEESGKFYIKRGYVKELKNDEE